MTTPPALRTLISKYQEKTQSHVRFRPPTWERTLGAENSTLSVLTDARYSWKDASIPSDRNTDREHVKALADSFELDDENSLLRAFLMVQAWGAGTTGSRTIRHTKSALADRKNLLESLRSTADILRGSNDPGALTEAYTRWRCAGVKQSFFTKWFTFAGARKDRHWQPLILDDRVLRSLNSTLNVTTEELAGSRSRARRYQSYVETIHKWAGETGVDAQRLEWILFAQNGKKLKQ
jgi:hypothetical protein